MEMLEVETFYRVSVPAGRYYLGDISYVFSFEMWDKFMEMNDCLVNVPYGTYYDGTDILGFRTKYGDGEYSDNEGYKYLVDTAMIGLVPATIIEKEYIEKAKAFGRFVEFKTSVVCIRHISGQLCFGDIVIETGTDAVLSFYDEIYDDPINTGNAEPS